VKSGSLAIGSSTTGSSVRGAQRNPEDASAGSALERLTAYQAVSSASQSLLTNAVAVTRMGMHLAVSVAADRCHEAWRDLQKALDLCAIIGTSRTRFAALSFAVAAEALDDAVSAYDNQVDRIGAVPEDGPAQAIRALQAAHSVIWGNTAHSEIWGNTSKDVNEDIDQLVALNQAVGVALDGAESNAETWHKAARAELGVPD
jgi:hypothetical protein